VAELPSNSLILPTSTCRKISHRCPRSSPGSVKKDPEQWQAASSLSKVISARP